MFRISVLSSSIPLSPESKKTRPYIRPSIHQYVHFVIWVHKPNVVVSFSPNPKTPKKIHVHETGTTGFDEAADPEAGGLGGLPGAGGGVGDPDFFPNDLKKLPKPPLLAAAAGGAL